MQCLQNVVSALQVFTSGANTVHLGRYTKFWDSFSRAGEWDSRENPSNLGLQTDLTVCVVLGISYSPGHPDRRSREQLGRGLTEIPCRTCHDKLAFLEVRAEFEESY